MTSQNPASEPLTPELYARIHGLPQPSARARLAGMFTPSPDAGRTEFERRVDVVVAEATAALQARVAELEARDPAAVWLNSPTVCTNCEYEQVRCSTCGFDMYEPPLSYPGS
ncbi:hypothetical protein ACIQ7D_17760 [Streptomyces sp. NPDC096310]|uniref:hypothetical protein n=1 Tax=Streptomyces sp. NPDC096310 TaxID=3366082 RepID=UPI003816A169